MYLLDEAHRSGCRKHCYKQMIMFAGKLVYSVYINRSKHMLFHRLAVVRFAVNLSGTGKNDFNIGVVATADFQNRQLRTAVNSKSVKGSFMESI